MTNFINPSGNYTPEVSSDNPKNRQNKFYLQDIHKDKIRISLCIIVLKAVSNSKLQQSRNVHEWSTG